MGSGRNGYARVAELLTEGKGSTSDTAHVVGGRPPSRPAGLRSSDRRILGRALPQLIMVVGTAVLLGIAFWPHSSSEANFPSTWLDAADAFSIGDAFGVRIEGSVDVDTASSATRDIAATSSTFKGVGTLRVAQTAEVNLQVRYQLGPDQPSQIGTIHRRVVDGIIYDRLGDRWVPANGGGGFVGDVFVDPALLLRVFSSQRATVALQPSASHDMHSFHVAWPLGLGPLRAPPGVRWSQSAVVWTGGSDAQVRRLQLRAVGSGTDSSPEGWRIVLDMRFLPLRETSG